MAPELIKRSSISRNPFLLEKLNAVFPLFVAKLRFALLSINN